jgi:hypothetical protein
MGIKSALVFLVAASAAVAAPIEESAIERRGNLPTPVSASTAKSYLNSIRIEAESNSPAYSRDYFKHWITISGTCNTRETVLKRDGSNVQTNSDCSATSGSWYSDYDGVTWSAASDVDIDHIVPLVCGDSSPSRASINLNILIPSTEGGLGLWCPQLGRSATTGLCQRVSRHRSRHDARFA